MFSIRTHNIFSTIFEIFNNTIYASRSTFPLKEQELISKKVAVFPSPPSKLFGYNVSLIKKNFP